MVLLIQGAELKQPDKLLTSLSAFLEEYREHFEDDANTLKALPEKRVSKESPVVYISQREFGVVNASNAEKVSAIGTDMATTCHIVVLQYGLEVTALGHFDGASTKQGVEDMVNSVVSEVKETSVKNTINLDLHIIGGFDDERKLSEKLSLELLREFCDYKHGRLEVNIHLKTFCASHLNMNPTSGQYVNDNGRGDNGKKAPVILGVLADCRSGVITPAVFDDGAKGPLPALRSARSLGGVKDIAHVYRAKEACFVIEPFAYGRIHRLEEWLEQPDCVIRQYMSTSPEVEPENFEEHIRNTLRFMLDNPNPLKSVFVNNEALVFLPVMQGNQMSWVKGPSR